MRSRLPPHDGAPNRDQTRVLYRDLDSYGHLLRDTPQRGPRPEPVPLTAALEPAQLRRKYLRVQLMRAGLITLFVLVGAVCGFMIGP